MQDKRISTDQYRVLIAGEEHLCDIMKVLNSPLREGNAFKRTETSITDSIRNGLFLLMYGPDGSLNTMAGFYLYPAKIHAGSTIDDHGRRDYTEITVAELGTLLSLQTAPQKIRREFMTAALFLLAHSKAQEHNINRIVTHVVATDKEIETVRAPGFGWKIFLPDEDFDISKQFWKTIDSHEDMGTKLVELRATPKPALLEAAKILLGLNNDPKFERDPYSSYIITAHEGKVEFDMSNTNFLPIAASLVSLNRKKPINSILDDCTPWDAARKKLNAAMEALTTAKENKKTQDKRRKPLMGHDV